MLPPPRHLIEVWLCGESGSTVVHIPRKRRRIIAVAAAIGVVAGTLVIGQFADASTFTSAPRVTLAYTSSAMPGKSFMNPTGDLPVGTSVLPGNRLNTSRVYATFDISQYSGLRIVAASLSVDAAAEANCADRALDIWQTAVQTYTITWQKSPAEISRIGAMGFSIGCPALSMRADIAQALAAAVAAGASKFAIELRVPAEHEADPQYGLTLSDFGVQLAVNANATPAVPTVLSQDQYACTTSQPYPFLGDSQPTLRATVGDADHDDFLTTEFDVWPVDHPENRTVITTDNSIVTTVHVTVPAGVVVDGGSYGWQARTTDGTDTSGWSQPCFFTADLTPPANAPGVDSPNYPPNSNNPGGVPVTLNLTPNGANDIIGYAYNFLFPPGVIATYFIGDDGLPVFNPFSGPNLVHADADGSATISFSPRTFGPVIVYVESFDKAFNVSPLTQYSFFVQSTAPVVTPVQSRPLPGKPFTLNMAPGPNTGTVDSYQVTVNETDVSTVTAASDGTASTTLSVPQGPTSFQISVSSHSTNGWISDPTQLSYFIDTSPIVTSDVYPENGNGGGVGVPGTFTFTSVTGPVASFTYEIDFGEDITVPVGPSGDSAQIVYTPDTPDSHAVSVYANNLDGTESDTYFYFFNVNE